MAGTFRVFISTVSSEFGQARDTLAASLRARDLVLRVQSDFRQEEGADTTLRKLHNYIRDCAAVVCVIGRRSGAMPAAAEAEPFGCMLPTGVTEASYTQWEFFFARHYKRRLSIYIAEDTWKPERDPTSPERPDLQKALVRHIVDEQGLDRHYFATVDALCHKVLLEDWPRERPPRPTVLPYPTLGTLFKGRDDFMRRLRDSLTRAGGGTAAIAQSVVHGMGGIGKTRAAVEYAHAHAHEYTAVALLDAETPEKLRSALAALIGPLRLNVTAPEEDVRVEAAIQWLNDNPGWFLILDNIDTDPALQAAHRMLGRLKGGHVVLTSRLTQFPRGVEKLDLDVLTLDDAVDFLNAATPSRPRAPDDAEQARLLAGELGQLALALEMAAATIEARPWTFAQYRETWQGNRARVIGWAKPEISGYHHAVAETWQTSVDQLSPEAVALLERLAFLAPDPIPEALLDAEADGVPTGEDARAALDDLVKYSLATLDPSGKSFLIHRLVQDVTQWRLTGTDRHRHRQRLTEALNQVYTAFSVGNSGDVRFWPVLDPLAPHAESVAALADTAGIAEPTANLLGRLARLFHAKARYARAEPFYRRALAIAEARFPANDPRIATCLNNLAQLLQATNRLGEAEPLMRRAIGIFETSYGKDHPEVATALNNLAQLLQATNRLGEAAPLMRRMVTIFLQFQRDTGHPHPNRDAAIGNYWRLLEGRGKSQDEIAATILGMAEAAGLSLG